MAHPSRAASSRQATARPAIGGEPKGRLHIDPDLLDPGFEYQWIRESTLGEPDDGSLEAAMADNGFSPVEASELPTVARPLLPGRKVDKAAEGLIRRGGLILMKRSREIAEEQHHAHAEASENAIRGVTKDLSGLADGKYVQNLPGGGVHSAMETRTESRSGDGQRFAE